MIKDEIRKGVRELGEENHRRRGKVEEERADHRNEERKRAMKRVERGENAR